MNTTTHRESDLRAQAVPRHPSNRQVYDKLIAWGWQPTKVKGGRMVMRAPVGDETIDVQQPQSHDANATSTFISIYRLTTQGDADLFWRGPSDLWLEMLKQRRSDEAARKEAAKKAPELAPRPPVVASGPRPNPEAPRPVAAAPAPTPQETTVPFTTTKTKPVPSIKDVQGAAWSMRSSKSFCIDDIAIRLGVDRGDKDAMKAVQNRVMQLCANGRLVRLKRGTYAYPQESSAVAAAMPAAPEPTTIAPAPVVAPPATALDVVGTTVIVATTPVAPVSSPVDVDGVIESVLDLLFPNGFKARHYRFIGPWIDVTKVMIKEVDNG